MTEMTDEERGREERLRRLEREGKLTTEEAHRIAEAIREISRVERFIERLPIQPFQ